MLCGEVSIYPQKTTNASQIIRSSIDQMTKQNIKCNIGSLSTHFDGNDEQVWQGIKAMFDEAKKNGEVNMVLTLSNAEH